MTFKTKRHLHEKKEIEHVLFEKVDKNCTFWHSPRVEINKQYAATELFLLKNAHFCLDKASVKKKLIPKKKDFCEFLRNTDLFHLRRQTDKI